jgi:translation initiation factor 2 beta subunit (eIF-2beta)/eIF-5
METEIENTDELYICATILCSFFEQPKDIPRPFLKREETNKTLWLNIYEICSIIERSPKHLCSFFSKELHTSCVLNDHSMVIPTRISILQLERLLSIYLKTYVECNKCNSRSTYIKKDFTMHTLECNRCYRSRALPMYML